MAKSKKITQSIQLKEIWRDISEYEGLYQISNFGRVKSLQKGNRKEKILKNGIGSVGYLSVGLYKDGKARTANVHRLVAEAFIPNPLNKTQVNHKDGCKANPIVTNLEWVTPSENNKHAFATGLSKVWNKGIIGSRNPVSKAIVKISKDGDIEEFDCMSDASRKYGFDSGAMTKVCQNKASNHKGYVFQYKDEWDEDFKKIRHRFATRKRKIVRISKDGETRIYESIADAVRDGFRNSGIVGVLKGRYHTSFGYKWKYYE